MHLAISEINMNLCTYMPTYLKEQLIMFLAAEEHKLGSMKIYNSYSNFVLRVK